MDMHSSTGRSGVVDSDVRTTSCRIPDSASTAETALNTALQFCSDKMKATGAAEVIDCLSRGETTSRSYFNYCLAQQIAAYLGTLDSDVKAVYLFDYDATPEDICFCESTQDILVHLIIWTRRKTAAQNSLLQALDRALIEQYAELMSCAQPRHFLDVHFVEDADVENRMGYGALLSSIHNRPVQVWERA